MNKSLSKLASFLLLSAIMVFSSCDKDDDNKTYANVMVVHASPDGPGVDLLIDGNKQNSSTITYPNNTGYLDVEPGTRNVNFTEGTAFTALDAGTYNLDVRIAGTSTVALVLPSITLQAGKIYTVFAKGFLLGTGAQALDAEIIVNK